jgi:hypothetical protein
MVPLEIELHQGKISMDSGKNVIEIVGDTTDARNFFGGK